MVISLSIRSRILLRGLSSLSLGLQRFQWRLLAFRIGRRISRLARLYIISCFRASTRNIWIKEGSLEDVLGHAGWQWMLCEGQIQSLQFVHCTVTARWRIVAVSSGLENPPLDSCNRLESPKRLEWAARSPPLSRKRKCVSTSLMRSAASCVHQDTRQLHLYLLEHQRTNQCGITCQTAQVRLRTIGTCGGPQYGENRSDLEKSGLSLEERNLICCCSGPGFGENRSDWEKSGLLLEKRNLIICSL